MSHPRLRLPRLTASPPQIRKASHGPMGPPTWPIAAHRHSRESAQTRRTPLADLQTHETGHKFAAKAFDCVDHNKLWKIIQEMGIPDHLICLLRNLYAGQEETVRTGHGTTDWFQIEKGVCQGCILSPCLFNLYAEYIMRNAGLEEAQAGIKISRRNINNLR